MYNQWSIKYIYKYIGLLSVFSPLIWNWGLGHFQLEKKASKQENWENSYLLQIKSEDIRSYMISII